VAVFTFIKRKQTNN